MTLSRTTQPVFLIGFMGVGKTTVGHILARRTGRPFVDVDARVEARVGCTVHQVFTEQGEAGFRALEAEALAEAATEHAVVAVGGGAPTWEGNLPTMRRAGVVVLLTAETEALLCRLEQGEGLSRRPLLSKVERGLLPEHIAMLYARRAAAYAQAHLVIDTTGRSPEEVAGLIEDALSQEPKPKGQDGPGGAQGETLRGPACEMITVEGVPPYPILLDALGEGAEDRLAAALLAALPGLSGGAKLALVTDENVAALHLPRVQAALVRAGLSPHVAVVPAGEEHKSLAQVERLAGVLLSAGMDRGGAAAILALGGGVVSDLAGFLAAILLRGIPWAAAPTTLLSQADAAIGGKTAVNLPVGKNLLGAFHSPRLVYADLSMLRTLPPREVASGLGEIVKHALLCGETELRFLEDHAEAVLQGDPALLQVLVGASCRKKAQVVAADPEERDPAGGRVLLNLGHTVGHALETASQPAGDLLRHGEAVALGLLAMARVSAGLVAAGPCAPCIERLEGRLRALFSRLHLPTDLDRRLFVDGGLRPEVTAALRLDKKRAGPCLRLVTLTKVGVAGMVQLTAEDLLLLLRGGAYGASRS